MRKEVYKIMHNYTLLDKNNSFILCKKICINLNQEQIQFCNKQFELSRALWNLYKEYLDKKFKETGKLYDWMEFGYFLNHELRELPEYSYLKDIKKNIKNGILRTLYTRYKMYKDYVFSKNKKNKRKIGVPKFKSKKKNELINYYYFEGNQERVKNPKMYNILLIRFTQSNTHINLPYLKEVELKEIGYLLEEDLPNIVISTLTYENHKFYVNLNIRYPNNYFLDRYPRSGIYGMGIDVGIKNYMTIYDGKDVVNITGYTLIGEVRYPYFLIVLTLVVIAMIINFSSSKPSDTVENIKSDYSDSSQTLDKSRSISLTNGG